jgi:hypothetical protein
MTKQSSRNILLAKEVSPSAQVTVVVSDQLAVRRGNYQKLEPWRDWAGFEADVRAVIRSYLDQGLKVDAWDIWSEPDTSAMWTGTCDQAMEMFERAARTIRSADLAGRVVAPSVSDVDVRGVCRDSFFSTFIQFAARRHLPIDAISWHEFDDPRVLPSQAQAVRKYLEIAWTDPKPELQVNEFSGPVDAPIPGWAVAWLANLEAAGVNAANRACWGTGCSSGLNGLFLTDNRTPTALYWVHRAYADLPSVRLSATVDDPDTAVLAARSENGSVVRLLLGRFQGKNRPGGARDLELTLDRLPWKASSSAVVIRRIARPRRGRLSAFHCPVDVPGKVVVVGGSLSLRLTSFSDGDAYEIIVSSGDPMSTP